MSRALLSEPGADRRRRADPGRRRRRARRDLSDPARSLEFRHAGDRQLVGRRRTRRAVRQGRRRCRAAGWSRRSTGADVTEARIVAAAVSAGTHAGDGGAPSNAASAADGGWRHFLQIGQRPGGAAGARHRAARALRLQPERQLLLGLQHLQHPAAGDRARLHRAWPDDRPADGRHRPVGRSACPASWWWSPRSSSTTTSRRW